MYQSTPKGNTSPDAIVALGLFVLQDFKTKERKRLMKQEEVDNPIVAVLQILIAVVVGVVSVLLGILFKQKNDF